MPKQNPITSTVQIITLGSAKRMYPNKRISLNTQSHAIKLPNSVLNPAETNNNFNRRLNFSLNNLIPPLEVI